ncbi:MAG: (4Fe-4S)-binding protein [Bacteroidia bacterium]|nr:(4Fe-4S)-binding protein [Bacteroidia bacterium]NNM23893.1 (4Fe-4S)-binding protein [Flavobacteriaceae bacterium]
METSDNQFSNREITVTYEPKKCIHAEACYRGLEEVFRTTIIPWINLDGADNEQIIAQVKKCPSGALSFTRVKELANS